MNPDLTEVLSLIHILDLLSETRTAAFLQKGMERDAGAISAFDALRMATVEGRRALGLPGGTLSLGAPADLILLNTSGCHMLPLGEDPYAAVLYCAKSSDVALTMVCLLYTSRCV